MKTGIPMKWRLMVLAALAVGSKQVNPKALALLHERDIETLVRWQRLETALLEVRFRAAGVLLEQLPIPGSLNHVKAVSQNTATLSRKLEPRAAKAFREGDALAESELLHKNWGLVDATLAHLKRGYVAKTPSA